MKLLKTNHSFQEISTRPELLHADLDLAVGGDYCCLKGCLMEGVKASPAQPTGAKHPAGILHRDGRH